MCELVMKLFKKIIKRDTYFCNPQSPWQKGQVEKNNTVPLGEKGGNTHVYQKLHFELEPF